MILQIIVDQYASFRKTLGERFETNGQVLAAFCRAMGQDANLVDVSSDKVSVFLAGKGPLTASWHVRHNALLGFYRYAISRGLVTTSPLPLVIPKRPPAFQPYIYSQAELLRLLDATTSYQRHRSRIDPLMVRALIRARSTGHPSPAHSPELVAWSGQLRTGMGEPSAWRDAAPKLGEAKERPQRPSSACEGQLRDR